MAKCREKGREGGAHLRGADARPRRPSPRRLPARQRGVSAQRPAHPAALPRGTLGVRGAPRAPREPPLSRGSAPPSSDSMAPLERARFIGDRRSAGSCAPRPRHARPRACACNPAEPHAQQTHRADRWHGSGGYLGRRVDSSAESQRTWHSSGGTASRHMATARAVARCLLGTRRVPSTLPRNALAARLRPTPVLRARAHASH